jgi:polysaccharide export outer membrane protein
MDVKIPAIVIPLLLLLCGCASHVGRLPPLPSGDGAPYLLGAGDTLQVVVYDQPDLSGTFRISGSGMIAMPLVGTVAAHGLTVDQFQQRLVERLQASALKSPDVTLSVSEYRPFFILGEVRNPGSYAYVPNMTVLTAVAIAGGFTYRASEREISVTRVTDGKPLEGQASRDSRVLPGDVVYVFERHL